MGQSATDVAMGAESKKGKVVEPKLPAGITTCSQGGKSGYMMKGSSTCYVHDGTPAGKAKALARCAKQWKMKGGREYVERSYASAEVGKPGTNFIQVPPQHVARMKGLLEYYRKKPHPFTACVRDNEKRFGEHTNQVCAVVKDLIEGNTHWRKGGNKGGRKFSDGEPMLTEADLDAMIELSIELGRCLADGREYAAFDESMHPRGWHGMWVRKAGSKTIYQVVSEHRGNAVLANHESGTTVHASPSSLTPVKPSDVPAALRARGVAPKKLASVPPPAGAARAKAASAIRATMDTPTQFPKRKAR